MFVSGIKAVRNDVRDCLGRHEPQVPWSNTAGKVDKQTRERLGVIPPGACAEGEKIANDPEQVLWINRL